MARWGVERKAYEKLRQFPFLIIKEWCTRILFPRGQMFTQAYHRESLIKGPSCPPRHRSHLVVVALNCLCESFGRKEHYSDSGTTLQPVRHFVFVHILTTNLEVVNLTHPEGCVTDQLNTLAGEHFQQLHLARVKEAWSFAASKSGRNVWICVCCFRSKLLLQKLLN